MMSLSKKALALAVTAATLGGGAMLAQAQVAVAPGGLGQAMVYPYMTANSGWQTFLHVINTSATTVAAKVRFRAAKDSVDVYDFIVVLSPYDVWTGVVEQGAGGLYGFRPTDNTCTVPYFGKDKFTPFIVQTSEVYAEVIMMGVSTATSTGTVGANAKHNTSGVPANCSAVESAFSNSASVTALTEFSTSLNVFSGTAATNFLTGKFDLVNVGQGWSGASRATVIANFGAPAVAGTGTGPYFANTNMWSQQAPDFDHPTLAEGFSGLTPLNTILTKTNLINEWVLNPNLGELSSWVVTFPTKKLTVDAITAINALSTQTPKLQTFGDATGTNAGCVTVTPALWNREEKQLVLASPGTTPLCYEANVLSFKSGAIDSKSVLNSNVAPASGSIPTDLLSTGVIAGWMNLGMPNNSVLHPFAPAWTTLPGWTAAPITGATAPVGRPVVGFNITARTTPSDTVLYDHAYLP
ncbi:MAG: hypothetical protein RKO66_12250 [Candidatus Contendobacter sp.]|nr:hypothetical protein [Candidatus Contendobacter sp.]MDS4030831.1 hypothetical protein [Candidatus Contendobacter sp.]